MLSGHECESCGLSFTGGPRAQFCPSCRAERKRAQRSDYRRRRRLGETRPLGSIDTCIVCGRPYEVAGGRQHYCPECARAAVAEIDRRQALEWYAKNKDRVNSARKAKRRLGPRPCVICGKMYEAPTVTKCCSDACRFELRRAICRRANTKRE